jgi:Lon protease-like protein
VSDLRRYLPVFPLGTVLLPSQVLPLHIFEDRYRVLMQRLTEVGAPAEIGVVLIERGSEVGGGDTRVATGTVAHLIESEELPDGRWVAIFAGSHRFRVESWLPDDPYPQAMVTEQADAGWDPADEPALRGAEAEVRAALHLAAELGEPVGPPGFILASDPAVAAWELCGRAPLGALDRQRLLESDAWPARLELLRSQVADAAGILAFRLHGG